MNGEMHCGKSKRWSVVKTAVVLLVPLAAHGCGGNTVLGEVCEPSYGNDYFPMVVGARWELDVTEKSDTTRKTWEIREQQGDDYRFHQEDGSTWRNTWCRRDDQGRVTWLRKVTHGSDGREDEENVPPRLRLDPALQTEWVQTFDQWRLTEEDIAGCACWSEDTPSIGEACRVGCSTPTRITDTWTVFEPAPEDVIARWGDDVLCHQKVEVEEMATTSTKIFCFKRGIGKVYEEQVGEQVERLVAVCFPAPDPTPE